MATKNSTPTKKTKRTKTNGAKRPRATSATSAKRAKKAKGAMSGLDAAARVLQETGAAMSCQAMLEVMLAKGYWSTGGQTPAATIYSALVREIAGKGKQARFKKVDRGLFALASKS
jgi:short subunit dehydrogenase-like uncharacterized protein